VIIGGSPTPKAIQPMAEPPPPSSQTTGKLINVTGNF
jgi:hypothetical protein